MNETTQRLPVVQPHGKLATLGDGGVSHPLTSFPRELSPLDVSIGARLHGHRDDHAAGHSDNRPDGSSDGRSNNRLDTRSDNRSDTRSDNHSDARLNRYLPESLPSGYIDGHSEAPCASAYALF